MIHEEWKLDAAFQTAKVTSSRSFKVVGAHRNLNGLRDLTTPLSGVVCHLRASTCYDQPIYQIRSL